MDNEISVLIIEDEALIAQSIKMQLESFGYSITAVCYKYETALVAINETFFDVMITDINLGNGIDKKSGIELVEILKKKRECPVIFLTAFSDKETIKKAASVSPSGYLVKPVNAANLFATVQLAVQNFTNKINPTPKDNETPDYFFVKQGSKLIKIFWKDVYHLEAVKNYVKLKSSEYNSSFLIRGSLQQVIHNMLPMTFKNDFVKINRAEVIAKNIITKINKELVETTFGTYKTTVELNMNA